MLLCVGGGAVIGEGGPRDRAGPSRLSWLRPRVLPQPLPRSVPLPRAPAQPCSFHARFWIEPAPLGSRMSLPTRWLGPCARTEPSIQSLRGHRHAAAGPRVPRQMPASFGGGSPVPNPPFHPLSPIPAYSPHPCCFGVTQTHLGVSLSGAVVCRAWGLQGHIPGSVRGGRSLPRDAVGRGLCRGELRCHTGGAGGSRGAKAGGGLAPRRHSWAGGGTGRTEGRASPQLRWCREFKRTSKGLKQKLVGKK